MLDFTPLPCAHSIQVWYASLRQSQAFVAQMEEGLSADERARMGRFHFPDDARRYAVRRGILRHLLAAYLSTPPQAITFDYGRQNKPVLTEAINGTGLHFNLSDSGEMAVYAFAVGQALGVDIEKERAILDARLMAERFFSPAENEWLTQQPDQRASRAFLRCWTCKEAVVKARGDGLLAPLQEFTVAHWQTPPRVAWPAQPASNWSIHLLDPPPGYIAALAAPSPLTAIHEEYFYFHE